MSEHKISVESNDPVADGRNTMWCVQCRQDVPAFSATGGVYVCPRCGGAIRLDVNHSPEETVEADFVAKEDSSTATPTELFNAPIQWDGWEMDSELRQIERVLRGGGFSADNAGEALQPAAFRFDLPCARRPMWHVSTKDHFKKKRKTGSKKKDAAHGSLPWLSLVLGLTCFACGGILLGWSLATGRQTYWTIGLPMALTGQIGLLLWLGMQFDRFRREHRAAAAKLEGIERKLHEIKHHVPSRSAPCRA